MNDINHKAFLVCCQLDGSSDALLKRSKHVSFSNAMILSTETTTFQARADTNKELALEVKHFEKGTFSPLRARFILSAYFPCDLS